MMEYALKSIIVATVDEVYIGKLRNKYTGYLGICSITMEKLPLRISRNTKNI